MIQLEIFKQNKGIKDFYKFEGKLATEPILDFLYKQCLNLKGVLDFGCGNKIYKDLFVYIDNYIGIDLYNDKADLKEDIKQTSLPSNYADIVICNQVIEHDPQPGLVIREIFRVLKNNGILLLSAPQMGRLHGEPHDYYRYTKYGLKYLLENNGFSIGNISQHGGFFRAFGSHFNFLLAEKYFKNVFMKLVLRNTIIRLINYSFPYLDKCLKYEKDTLGYNIIAYKKRNK